MRSKLNELHRQKKVIPAAASFQMPILSVSKVKMHYRETGGGHQTLLFLHGNLASSLWWERVFPLLPQRWHAIAPDMRGFGQSEKPPEGYSVEELASDLSSFIRQLGLCDFTLVGHSLGGAVALQYALEHQAQLKALVLVDPVPANGLRFDEGMIQALSGMQGNRVALEAGLRMSAPRAPDDAFFDRLVEEALQATPMAFAEIPRKLADFNLTPRLSELSVPTLCIRGEMDVLIPPHDIDQMARQIPGCRLEVIRGVGHSPQVEAPRKFTELLLDFLSFDSPQTPRP